VNVKIVTSSIITAFLCLCSDVATAELQDIDTTTQSFSIKLGATRIVYDPASNGTTLTALNPQNYPILLQSEALMEDMTNRAPFMVVPPILRLDPQQQSRLRIVRTGGIFPEDRETMQWICAKGIPPKEDDAWAKSTDGKSSVYKDKVSMNIQLSINSCIKLFVRPTSIKGSPVEAAGKVGWEWQAGKLKGKNNSPFYINIINLNVGGVKVPDAHYIPPFGSYIYNVSGRTGSQVEWKVINDYGGESKIYRATVR